jgi:ABC-2 type transport system ATP-binding protein
MQGDAMLKIEGVKKTFKPGLFKKPFRALTGVDLLFRKGECTGLLGHNGAGKTTTIRLVLGLIKPDAGKIYFENHALGREDRGRIGYLPETVRMSPNFTCREVLQTHVQLYDFPSEVNRKKLVEEKLDEVGMLPFATRKIRELSKGMAQRVAWAQATIHNPDLLILDEPFSGLDPVGRATMKRWILEEKNKKRTMILCTHELPQVISLCDHVHILRRGSVVYNTFGSRSKDLSPKYILEISGASSEQLTQIAAAKSLPQWTSIKQEGFLVRLEFSDYGAASEWLGPITKAGFVVVRFGDDQQASEEQLLAHFKEEFTI